MKLEGILLLIITIHCGFVSAAQEKSSTVKRVSLKECLNLTMENAPGLKTAALEQRRLEFSTRVNRGIGLPQVGLSGSYDDNFIVPTQMIPNIFSSPPNPDELIPVQFGTNYNINGSLDLTQVIYNQSWLSSMKLAKLLEQQNVLQTEKTRTELVHEVAQSYYLAQITFRQIGNLRQNLEKLEKSEKIASSQYNSGLIIRIDLDRIVVQKLNLQTEIDRLEVLYQQQLDMQKYYMGIPSGTEIDLADSISTDQIPLKQGKPENHIDIRMFEMQKEVAQTSIRISQASFYPNLTFVVHTNYINQSNDFSPIGQPGYWFNSSLAGINLHMPLFTGWQNRNRVSASRIELEKLKIQEEDTRKMLTINSDDALRKLVSGMAAEKRQQENMKLAERVFTVTQEQYQKGVVPLTDLLNAETALSDAQTNHIYSLIQVKINELNYLKANGFLLDHFKL